jgi:ABC-2 type transport system ATP-binding protein
MPAVTTDGLAKTYYTSKKQPGMWGAAKALLSREKVAVEAVKGVSLSIEEGELVGFLGPNGAGKTTTLKMLTGILVPSGGDASVLGHRPWERKPEMQRQISLVMGNKQQLWWDLPAWDSFQVLKEIYDVSQADFKRRVDHLVEALQLPEKLHTQVRRLSLGERMKCELVAALLHNPRVVFLDEPTIGLDVISQKRIREFLKEHNRDHKTTVLLTSHYMQDVAELCERVIVIDHGTMIYDGALAELTRKYRPVKKLVLVFREPVTADLTQFGEVITRSDLEATIEVPRESTTAIAAKILSEYPVEDIAIEEPEAEEVIRALFEREPSDSLRAAE